MDRDAEARPPRLLDHRLHRAVVEARAAGARPGDVDADDAARPPADRLLDDDLVLPRVKVRSIIRIRPALHLRVLEGRRSMPRIAAGMMWSRSRSPPRLRFIGLKRSSIVVMPSSGSPPDRPVDRGLDRQRARLDQLRPMEELVERVEVGHAARVATP